MHVCAQFISPEGTDVSVDTILDRVVLVVEVFRSAFVSVTAIGQITKLSSNSAVL